MSRTETQNRVGDGYNYTQQAEKLSLRSSNFDDPDKKGVAVVANFVTPLDPVIETADGSRLPGVPIEEAHKLNGCKDRLEGRRSRAHLTRPRGLSRFDIANEGDDSRHRAAIQEQDPSEGHSTDTHLRQAVPPLHTHPLFPPLPLYGPPSWLRAAQCALFKVTGFFLSTGFLLVIVLGAIFTSLPPLLMYIWQRFTFRDPFASRPFREEELSRVRARKKHEKSWKQSNNENHPTAKEALTDQCLEDTNLIYQPTEGGPDRLICDIGYYARRVGLDAEEFKVQTEDGFLISLFHIYDPTEYISASQAERRASKPEIFDKPKTNSDGSIKRQFKDSRRRYPVLLMHGLLQSAGAYCCNDADSLAFYLTKAGYDVWLGNNRCGFKPEHTLLSPRDPRMYSWNIRQMGVLDLPAFVSRILYETGFEKLGLVAHSQGTTQTFVALAKEQRPDIGNKISVFCALAPAVYAGPLIGKMYFKFMRVISPAMFRVFFGIHSFIPQMMTAHKYLPGRLYGLMGYLVFSFLFNWSDTRWDRGLRDRFFQFSPVYVSAESMRWWLGRECFAKHKCILSTREEGEIEDIEDEEAEMQRESKETDKVERGRKAWYDENVPPMALWIAGRDELVDGRRLLRRFEQGREPHVNLVHKKVIEDYEHLDVIWALDSVSQVGKEVKHVLERTMPGDARRRCRKILGVDEEAVVLVSDEQE